MKGFSDVKVGEGTTIDACAKDVSYLSKVTKVRKGLRSTPGKSGQALER